MKPLIDVHGLDVKIGSSTLLSGVNLEVEPGECVSVVGPNGAGKSTLAKVLAGLIPPTSGTVKLGDTELRTCSPLKRAEIVSYVPQRVGELPGFTVEDFVSMSRYRFARNSGVSYHDTEHYIRLWSLVKLAKRPLSFLSGGELQRVLLAGAMAQESSVLILDEPTTFLDVSAREEVLEILSKWRKLEGRSLLLVTHDLVAMQELSDRVVGMREGSFCGVERVQSPEFLSVLASAFETRFERFTCGTSSIIVPVKA